MAETELTPDIKVSEILLDQLAGLLVTVQRTHPERLLEISRLVGELNSQLVLCQQLIADQTLVYNTATRLLNEIAKIRGPWAVCYLCKPPKRIKVDEVKQHDIQLHGAYRG